MLRTSVFFFLLTSLFVFFWIQGDKEYGFRFNWITGLLCLNALFSAGMLSYAFSTDGVSLRVIYWFYSCFFFGIVPVFQHSTGLWRYAVPDEPIPWAVLIVIIAHICFMYGHKKGLAERQRASVRPDTPTKVRIISNTRLKLATISSIGITVALIAAYGFNPSGSVVREAFGYQFGPVESITEFLVRPTVFFFLLITVFRFRGQKKTFMTKAFLFIMIINILLLIGPFSANRSMIFFLYFGLLVLMYPPTPKRSFFYMLVLILGIVGSHFQDEFRFMITGTRSEVNEFSIAYLFRGHFDGFENLCHIINYIEIHGVVWGWQLLGVIFFYVPRAIWPAKPVGSGEFIAWEYLNNKFFVFDGNIATPLVAESFLNFHIIGVVVALFFCGYICGKLDKRYQFLHALFVAKKLQLLELKYFDYIALVFYPVLLGLFLFILRGDLMSGATFFVGMFIAFNFALFLTTKKVTVLKSET